MADTLKPGPCQHQWQSIYLAEAVPGPCPFCGSTNIELRGCDDENPFCACCDCFAEGPSRFASGNAISQWNRISCLAMDLKASKQILISEIEKNAKLAKVNRELVKAMEDKGVKRYA